MCISAQEVLAELWSPGGERALLQEGGAGKAGDKGVCERWAWVQ